MSILSWGPMVLPSTVKIFHFCICRSKCFFVTKTAVFWHAVHVGSWRLPRTSIDRVCIFLHNEMWPSSSMSIFNNSAQCLKSATASNKSSLFIAVEIEIVKIKWNPSIRSNPCIGKLSEYRYKSERLGHQRQDARFYIGSRTRLYIQLDPLTRAKERISHRFIFRWFILYCYDLMVWSSIFSSKKFPMIT